MKDFIEISLIRITKDEQERNNNKEFEVEFKNGIYVLVNNFKKFDEYKKNNIYVPVKVISNIEEVSARILYRLQKEKLNPIESALLYNEYELINEKTPNELAKKINVSQGNISNKKRLLKLPLNIQVDIIKGIVTERHGRALLQLKDNKEALKDVYEQILVKKLKVADAELLIDKKLNKKRKEPSDKIEKIKDKSELKNRLAVPAINQLEKDLNKTLELIEKYYPELEIQVNNGVVDKDYVFKIDIKNVK